ncbi:MarP family serine protease [Gryllotalpicola reticulitermitis]|uniref:MarP family serine protease n=1 Tax=Gryllotalpicola reticulitermitis TaxID=1184153 RepID=A0ABV8QA73_9MICO
MQVIVDLVLAVVGVLTVIRYARRGVIAAVAALIGWAIGFWVGLVLAPGIVSAVGALSSLQTWGRSITVLIITLLIAAVCATIVITIGSFIRRAVRPLPVAGGADAVLGAVFGLLSWAVVVWLLAGFVVSTGYGPATQLANSSRIVATLDSIAPMPTARVFGAVDDAIAAAGLPKVFESTEQEKIPNIAAPTSDVPSAVSAVADSIVEVQADEPQCGTASSGSGWVVASDRVITNAHVVAGSSSADVLVNGKSERLSATVVGYDPETDIAVLDVPGLHAKPLAQNPAVQGVGASVFAAGYPGGGTYTVAPGRVRDSIRAIGKDIYDDKTVTRDVYSLRAIVRPGDSGGPLLDAQGRVTGLVFAMSTTDSETGYALTFKQIAPTLERAATLTKPVATGACVSG